ncbi:peroxidase 16-like [Macadamia integrifolia]|uniref:peroxidase 16-like n=1 Tax=Macadamia integrifolia TaxID=60698 RepID=UPI001C4EF3FF|nr:peroxidase 16-like [Macadamia integrifolia]
MEHRSSFLLSFLLLLLLLNSASAQLKQNFYQNICPNVENYVRNAVEKKFNETFVTAPGTLRLFFHDCFVRGCDASVLLASSSNNAEKDSPIGQTLAGDGFDTVIKAKAAVDNDPNCKNKVSCADILALAARDVIVLTGGPSYTVELGRLDGTISTKSSVHSSIPLPTFSLDKLTSMFSATGLSQTDLVALSGAHTIGFSHCARFTKRLYGFSRRSSVDPSLNSNYAKQLQQACPKNVDPRVAVNMDPNTPRIFDNNYYKNLQQGMGLFTSDQVLFTDTRTTKLVNLFASNSTAFEQAFITAITNLGRVRVKVGSQGEIRHDCTAVN